MTDDDRGGALEIAEPSPALLLREDDGGTESLLASLSRLRSALDRERAEAPVLAAELLALAPVERRERLRRDGRFHTWGLCELLLARSLEAGIEPAEAGGRATPARAGGGRGAPPARAPPAR